MSKDNVLSKCPTGIYGFDQICEGGLPKYRSSLICGPPGSGKSLFGIEFLTHGITKHNEPGVLISFEEKPEDIQINVSSLGHDLALMENEKNLKIINIELYAHTMQQSGDYNLEGLFVRIGAAIDAVNAKRIVLDAVDNLFSAFTDQTILRAEFIRLSNWLKEKKVTAFITTEQGDTSLTRSGIEEYLSDCVVLLDMRVKEQLTTRVLRVVKYRGSFHSADEFPFLIDRNGLVCMLINEQRLDYAVSNKVFTSGINSLDTMLGDGVYYGSSVLISGSSGTGKSTLAAHYANASCKRGEKTLFVAMEESPAQIKRNFSRIGIDLSAWEKNGVLEFSAQRPSNFGLEMYLAVLIRCIDTFNPKMVIIDPISSFRFDQSGFQVERMLQRVVDTLKARGITSIFTTLTRSSGELSETSSASVSSLMDTWILLRNFEANGERTRGIYVIKSRGQNHSNQIRELMITDQGIDLEHVMINESGEMLIGSRRRVKELADEREAELEKKISSRLTSMLDKKRKDMEIRVSAFKAELQSEIDEIEEKYATKSANIKSAGAIADKISLERTRGK